MRSTDPLNDRQLAVLQWIADGCPDGVLEGHGHKTTAGALRDRRLVTISKSGGRWRAVVTPRGRHYLAHGAFAEEPSVHRPRQRRTGHTQATCGAQSAAAGTAPEQVSSVSVGELLAELEVGDGVVTIADPPLAIRAAWRRAGCRTAPTCVCGGVTTVT